MQKIMNMSSAKTIAILAVGLAAGWFVRGMKASQIVEEHVRKSEATTAVAKFLRAENDELRKIADSTNAIAEATPVPTKYVTNTVYVVDTLLHEVHDTIRIKVVAIIDTLEAKNDSLHTACENCNEARLDLLAWGTNLSLENDSVWSALNMTRIALDEATMPDPWYWSDVTKPIYSALASSLITASIGCRG